MDTSSVATLMIKQQPIFFVNSPTCDSKVGLPPLAVLCCLPSDRNLVSSLVFRQKKHNLDSQQFDENMICPPRQVSENA